MKRRFRWKNYVNRRHVFWFGNIVLALVLWVLWVDVIAPRYFLPPRDTTFDESFDHEPPPEKLGTVESLAEDRRRHEDVVKAFMKAGNDEERCGLIVGGDEKLDRLAEFYGREGNGAPKGFEEITSFQVVDAEDLSTRIVEATDEAGKEWRFVVCSTNRAVLIDWESSVGYSGMGWKKLLAEGPLEPVELRVFVKKGRYYNYEFSDESKYVCYELWTEGEDDVLYGYVEKDSDASFGMAMAVKGKVTRKPLTLRVRHLPWSQGKRMVLIEGFHFVGWLDREGALAALRERGLRGR